MSGFKGKGHTDLDALEQRVLDAARREQPSPDLSERMARNLGISLSAVATATAHEIARAQSTNAQSASAQSASTESAASPVAEGSAQKLAEVRQIHGGRMNPQVSQMPDAAKQAAQSLTAAAPSAGTSLGSLLPWIAGGVAVTAIAGAALTLSSKAPVLEKPETSSSEQLESPIPVSSSVDIEPSPRPAPEPASEPPRAKREAKPVAPSSHKPKPIQSSDLREQIALVDAARAAVRAGNGARALTLVGTYQKRFPKGSFRPEATALKIEALVKQGRQTEARALAKRFVVRHNGTPLGERVARLVGLKSQP